MFEILKKEHATPEQLAEAYVEAEKFMLILGAEKKTIYSHVLALQKDFLDTDSKSLPKELSEARNKNEDLKIKIESCLYGMDRLKERIAVEIPKSARERIEEINGEYSRLTEERHKRFLAFLKAAAAAVVLKEEIEWREFNYSNKLQEPQEVWPSLKFSPVRLDEEDRHYFLEQVQKYREKSSVKSAHDAIDKKMGELSQENYRLKEGLEDFNPDRAVEDLLSKFRPEIKSSEEEEEQEEPKMHATTVVHDYDKNPIQPDYEEGTEPAEGVPTGVGFSTRRP